MKINQAIIISSILKQDGVINLISKIRSSIFQFNFEINLEKINAVNLFYRKTINRIKPDHIREDERHRFDIKHEIDSLRKTEKPDQTKIDELSKQVEQLATQINVFYNSQEVTDLLTSESGKRIRTVRLDQLPDDLDGDTLRLISWMIERPTDDEPEPTEIQP
jgi:hypothetical protein